MSKPNTTTINLQAYKSVLEKWKELNPTSKLPVTDMLEEFGVNIHKLSRDGKDLIFNISNAKSLLLAKMKYNF